MDITAEKRAFEKDILRFINDRGEAGTSDLMNYTGRSKNTVIGMLKKLED